MRKGARPKVLRGPRGLCACCNRPTEISKGAVGVRPSSTPWVIPPELLRAVYSSVRPVIRTDSEGQHYVNDPLAFRTGRVIRRSCLYFVEGGRTDLAGPFGPEGLQVFFSKTSRKDHPLYLVSTTHRSLSRILASPFAELPSVQTGEMAPEELF